MEALLLFALIIGAIWLQVRAVMRWNGLWRWLAAVPLAFLVADIVSILIDTSIDPTARNLWPLELLMVVAVGLPATGLLWLVRRLARI